MTGREGENIHNARVLGSEVLALGELNKGLAGDDGVDSGHFDGLESCNGWWMSIKLLTLNY